MCWSSGVQLSCAGGVYETLKFKESLRCTVSCCVTRSEATDPTLQDPDAKKPDDWDERPRIDDPEDTKPDDWDDAPATIPDPDAKKPDDWDEDDDGVWEAPSIPNPEHKGEWRAKTIENPAYKARPLLPTVP